MKSFVPATLLSVLLSSAPVRADDVLSAAQLAVSERKFSDARRLYRELHARDPGNPEYQLWIGRLSGWLQEYEIALESFDEVLAREPFHVEALLGKAYVLMWQRSFAEAIALIRQVEELDPGNPEVHLAVARYHYYRGDLEDARSFLQRTLELDPGNREAEELLVRIPRAVRTTLVLGYEGSHFSYSEAGHVGLVEAGLRRRGSLILLRYEESQLFGSHAHRAGLELSRRVAARTWVRGGAAFAPGAGALPVQAYNLGVSAGFSGGVALGLDYRFYDFRDATVQMFAPAFEYYFKKPIWIETRLFNTRVRQRDATDPEHAVSFQARYHQILTRRLSADFGYARGQETFTTVSVDRLDRFGANTIIGGADFKVKESWGLRFYSLVQLRSDGENRTTVGLSVVLER